MCTTLKLTIIMKTRFALLAAAALLAPVYAADAADPLAGVPVISTERISGSLSAGYNTNYTGRGYVVTHSAAQGDSTEFIALKLKYDMGAKDLWSFESTVAYTVASSGHTLFGNPTFGPNVAAQLGAAKAAQLPGGVSDEFRKQVQQAATETIRKQHVKEANVENEFVVINAFKYTRDMWNVSFGHDFIHGGLLGVMAKHFRHQGASCVNEIFISPVFTPTKWLETGVTTRFSFQGITGWWFEPYLTLKAPIIGTADDVKLAGTLTLAMSATADYFQSRYFACKNGSQAFWIKLATPYFATQDKNLIITPAVSFNWAGKGAMKANERSSFKKYTEDPTCVPFRNFGVVGSISCTYVF